MLLIFIAVFKVNIHHKTSQVQGVIRKIILGHLCKNVAEDNHMAEDSHVEEGLGVEEGVSAEVIGPEVNV